jgi:hypothetical protein
MRKSLVMLLALAAPMFAAEIKLFNGKDLNGWARLARHEGQPDHAPGFKIENGMLITDAAAPEDDIWYTREKIGNATIRVVYKVDSERANSGIFIRIPEAPKSEDDAINKGIEVQIDQGDDDWHCTGVLYSMVKAKARPSKPIGEWNTMIIEMRGPRTKVTVNGVVVTDYDGVTPAPEKAKSYEPDRGPRPDMGYIAVQHHSGKGVVTFKEITLVK